jgi:hypothetical protein
VGSFLAEIADLVASQSDMSDDSDPELLVPDKLPTLGKEQLRIVANSQDFQKPGKWIEAIDAASGDFF